VGEHAVLRRVYGEVVKPSHRDRGRPAAVSGSRWYGTARSDREPGDRLPSGRRAHA